MRRADVRVVTISGFSAGALVRDCRAALLPPALSREWFDTLAVAAETAGSTRGSGAGQARGSVIRLATAFRLSQWRTKGLSHLIEAVDCARASGCPADHLRKRRPVRRPAAPSLRALLVRTAARPRRRRARQRAGCRGLVRAGHADQGGPQLGR